jgi:hypothetical protein
MYQDLLAALEDHKPGPKAKLADVHEYIDRVMKLLDKQRECRLDAQKCAVDCAGFVHPKLSSMSVNLTNDTIKTTHDENGMSDEELADYYNKLRLRPTSTTPLTIDNDTGNVVQHEDEE